MNAKHEPGLGEQLRYLSEKIDAGAEAAYRAAGLDYRARFTPVMRALAHGGEATVSEITAALTVTQGAVSQTIKLMENSGLVLRRPCEDARRSALALTPEGIALFEQLEKHWARIFGAVQTLEREIDYPLQAVLARTITALEERDFAERLRDEPAPGPEPKENTP